MGSGFFYGFDGTQIFMIGRIVMTVFHTVDTACGFLNRGGTGSTAGTPFFIYCGYTFKAIQWRIAAQSEPANIWIAK